ncbi:hypothetical protein PO350_16120 [Escherichia coli]
MSKRNDITDGIFATTKKYGLVYTEELGWIDLGHAQGQDARILKRKLEQEHFQHITMNFMIGIFLLIIIRKWEFGKKY